MTNFQPAKTIPEFIENFIIESNAIERIYRAPTDEEIAATHKFLELDTITIEDLQEYVKTCQPDAVLRDKEGLDVYVGDHVPPKGGKEIKARLEKFLKQINEAWSINFANFLLGDSASSLTKYASKIVFDPFLAHKEYESLHPFTDCNGRSGRVIWLWQMLKLKKNLAPLGFLQTWYYQSLSEKK